MRERERERERGEREKERERERDFRVFKDFRAIAHAPRAVLLVSSLGVRRGAKWF